MKTTITFGKYRLPSSVKPAPDTDEPIWVDWEWIVLNEDSRGTVVISKDAVDWQFFSGENTLFEPAKPVSWEKSYIRKVLRELYSDNFTFEEKCRILPNDTGDHLFLLTADEVRKYLKDPGSRIAEIIWADEDLERERICWWLNSVGSEPNMMQVVDIHGGFDELYIDSDEVGLRPCLIIDSSTPFLMISRFSEQRKVYVFPRMVGPDETIIRHACDCCRYVEKAGGIPVLDPELYPQVMRHMADNGLPLAVYYAAGTPIEECTDLMIFTQSPSAEVREARRRAKLIGIPIWNMVGVRLTA